MAYEEFFVENGFQDVPFTMVPNYVARSSISAASKSVLLYVCSHSKGFQVRISKLQADLGLGRRVWERVAKELTDLGALSTVQQGRKERGQFAPRVAVFRWPSPETVAKVDALAASKLSKKAAVSGDAESVVEGANSPDVQNVQAADHTYKTYKTIRTKRTEPCVQNVRIKKNKEKQRKAAHVSNAPAKRSLASLPSEGKGSDRSAKGDKTQKPAKGGNGSEFCLEKPKAISGDIHPSDAFAIVEGLSPFQKKSVREGSSFALSGVLYAPNTQAFAKLADALRFLEGGAA